jgi:hypothetical protein
MNRVVVDTDVVSLLFKDHPMGSRYDPELAWRIPVPSVVNVAELERSSIQCDWSVQRLH